MINTSFELHPIGIIRSPYKQKFAVPRQPNLVKSVQSELHLMAPYHDPNCVRGLEQFSHIWICFIFNQIAVNNWHPTVRPPRLGGNKRVGVFATRSMFRPNPIGLSVTELHSIVIESDRIILKLGSLDLVDGTPVIDIKPYLPFSDIINNAVGGYATDAPENRLEVCFSSESLQQLTTHCITYPKLQTTLTEVLAQDPRPAYRLSQQRDTKSYAIRLYDLEIDWSIKDNRLAYVENIKLVQEIP